MTTTKTSSYTPELLEQMFDRLSRLSERLAKDVEEQLRLLDRKIKSFLDRGEKATDRFVETIDKELRDQIASLKREVEHLSRRVGEFTVGAASLKKVPVKSMAKKTPANTSPAQKPSARTMKPTARTTPVAKAVARLATRKVAA